LSSRRLADIEFDHLTPDADHNWINIPTSNFAGLAPLVSKETKVADSAAKERALFKHFALGMSTNRDEWVLDHSAETLEKKVQYFTRTYNETLRHLPPKIDGNLDEFLDTSIKWSESLRRHLVARESAKFKRNSAIEVMYRPFAKMYFYPEKMLSDRLTANHYEMFGSSLEETNTVITISSGKRGEFGVLATSILPSLDMYMPNGTVCVPMMRYDDSGHQVENITQWSIEQFNSHYKSKKPILGRDIFNYVYGVLHDPIYREKFALNLRRDLPSIPFYSDFWDWAGWGKALIELHVGYLKVPRHALKRVENKSVKDPQPKLKADVSAGEILLDSKTLLKGIPQEAWAYRLGNRSAIEWVLDHYKETSPSATVIRDRFNSYRFKDYKDDVIDLLSRICNVSIQTDKIMSAMKRVPENGRGLP
jgi:predicted helicase